MAQLESVIKAREHELKIHESTSNMFPLSQLFFKYKYGGIVGIGIAIIAILIILAYKFIGG